MISKFVNATPIGSRPCGVKFMRAKTLLVLTGVFFASFGWAQTDPFIGTWSLVSGPATNGEIHIARENGQLRMKLKVTFKDGRLGTQDNIVQFDGRERPMNSTGDTKHSKHTVAWKRIDDHTIEQQINHDDGKEHSTARYAVSPDGKELTQTIVVQQPDGTWHQTAFVKFARQ